MQTNKKDSFTSKIGFILAAAGSAVGLGNIWRFPYLAAKYGGGIFLLVYVILVVTFGFTLMITEISIGRRTGKSAISAFSIINKKYSFIGYLSCIAPAIIFSYYCVIGGWVIKYLAVYTCGTEKEAVNDSFFGEFISGTSEPLIWMAIFLGVTLLIVIMGVQKGVENVSKIMMPVLVILSIVIAVYVLTLPGSMDGVVYYLKPDFSRLSVNTVFGAMSQMFYSMSLAMGIMITYGSYMKKEDDIESSVRQIELFDTGMAFISGLIVIPAVFSFSNGDETALSSGPGLMFETLPKVFGSMAFGRVIGALFFVLVLFAALTSAISLMETVVSFVLEKTKLSRIKATLLVGGISALLAFPSSLGYGALGNVKIMGMNILDFLDFITNSVFMPIVALLTCIFIGYVVKTEYVSDEVKESGKFKSEKLYKVILKYVAPIFIIFILVTSILSGLGIVQI